MGQILESAKLTKEFIKAGSKYHHGKSTVDEYLATMDKAISEHSGALPDSIKAAKLERARIAEMIKP